MLLAVDWPSVIWKPETGPLYFTSTLRNLYLPDPRSANANANATEMNTRLAIEEVAESLLSTPETIQGWLRGLKLGDNENEVVAVHPSPQRPLTPVRQPLARNNRPSPTDTNFSGDSIFDRPEERSPCSKKRSSYAFSDTSETSTGSDEYSDWQRKEDFGGLVCRPPAPRSYDKVSLISYDPPTELDVLLVDEVPNKPAPSLVIDYEEPHFIFLTSCLQCQLKDMPCSRTLPACSRCVRTGCGHLCLLHRRKLRAEMVDGDIIGNGEPVLLKVKGEDEDLWERKMALYNKLFEKWSVKQDQMNWVLPSFDNNTSREHNHVSCKWPPGEGIGHQSFMMLYLAAP
ncbi:hypothetical protein CC78DRAFT_326559 [Lojkania enalia]|uniref:Zn(2)-C6 fungal-type domain-containing protein n=1 Tax=Lojkania enalia TaxID=147567 RepID=A0A9P4K4Q2_9PLEO|nr:hypothetical protein CC78DRAFT_326559 [Didymosphaeria enalia]